MDKVKLLMFNKVYHTFLSNPVKINKKTPRLFRDNGALENIGQGMVRLRCIVEIEGLLTLVKQGIQQANRGVAQVGTGKDPKRCFDLFSYVCVYHESVLTCCTAALLHRLK